MSCTRRPRKTSSPGSRRCRRTADILLVHQSGLAKHLAATLAADGYAQPLTIVTGHNHIQQIDRYAGRPHHRRERRDARRGRPVTGGPGVGGVWDSSTSGEIDPALQSVDLIRIEPLSGQAQAERVVLDVACPPDETDEEPCHYEPG